MRLKFEAEPNADGAGCEEQTIMQHASYLDLPLPSCVPPIVLWSAGCEHGGGGTARGSIAGSVSAEPPEASCSPPPGGHKQASQLASVGRFRVQSDRSVTRCFCQEC